MDVDFLATAPTAPDSAASLAMGMVIQAVGSKSSFLDIVRRVTKCWFLVEPLGVAMVGTFRDLVCWSVECLRPDPRARRPPPLPSAARRSTSPLSSLPMADL